MGKRKGRDVWLISVRAEQEALARKYCSVATDKLSSVGNPDSGLTDDAADSPVPSLKAMVAAMIIATLEQQMLGAIVGYSDWLARRMVRSGRFAPIVIAAPNTRAAAAICRKHGIKSGYLEYVVMRLSAESRLPGLGAIDGGVLNPDRNQVIRWVKSLDAAKPSGRR